VGLKEIFVAYFFVPQRDTGISRGEKTISKTIVIRVKGIRKRIKPILPNVLNLL